MHCSGITSLDFTYLSALQWEQHHLQIQSFCSKRNPIIKQRKSCLNLRLCTAFCFQETSSYFLTVYLNINIFHARNYHAVYLNINIKANNLESTILRFKQQNYNEAGRKHPNCTQNYDLNPLNLTMQSLYLREKNIAQYYPQNQGKTTQDRRNCILLAKYSISPVPSHSKLRCLEVYSARDL